MVFATIIGGLFGPDLLKLFTMEESGAAGAMVLVCLAPFMAKMGVGAGANLARLVEVGPALLLQEFGNLGTILISLPVALLLGLKKEAIGACYSINRDSNLGLTTDIYGPDAPETKGTFAVYIVGSVIGTVFMSLLASIVASWNIFHPLALGMASGVGSGSMMTAAAGTLAAIYPDYADVIPVLGGASDMLTGITGIYMGTLWACPSPPGCTTDSNRQWEEYSPECRFRQSGRRSRMKAKVEIRFFQQMGLLALAGTIMVLTNMIGYKYTLVQSLQGYAVRGG